MCIRDRNLFLLVAFACNQNHITGGGLLERQANGGGTVRLDGVTNLSGLEARFYLCLLYT